MGFFDSLNDTMSLGKNTFTIIGKNTEILKPTIAQIKIALVLYILLIASIFSIFYANGALQIIGWLLVFPLLLVFFLFPYVKTYYKAAQCWIVYNAFGGKNITYQDGLKRANENKGDIITLATIDIITGIIVNQLKNGKRPEGLFGIIIGIVLSFIGTIIEEGWDLISHFLLPASIIEEKTVREVLPELKDIKNNITGALAGVLGIGFAGDQIRGYITGFVFALALIGAIIGQYTGFWAAFYFFLVLGIGIDLIAKILIDMIKTIYFTLFYMSVNMPMSIKEEYRKDVTQYLVNRTSTGSTSQPTETIDQKVTKLRPYIENYRKQGYNDKDIIKFLTQNNWPEEAVKKALEK